MRRWLALSVLLAGCTGVIGAGEPEEPAAPPLPRVNGARIVRLTHRAYDRTVEDLLGDKTRRTFPADGAGTGFDNTAAVLTVSEGLAIEYQHSARKLAEQAALDKLLDCDPAAADCARRFVTSFGKRAFRRPLREDELTAYVDLWQRARDALDGATGVRLVIETMLQSPSFLFRTELSNGRLDPYETASALSYVLWETMPDETLFLSADRNELSTREQLAAQVRRMLRDPRARAPMVEMFSQMLELHGLRDATRDAPFDAAAMTSAFTSLINDVVFERNGDLGQLLNGGLLTTPAFLTTHATPLASSPPRRGKVVAEHFLCRTIAPPPPDVAATVPATASGTTREKFAAHTTNATCRGCHAQLDPLGFAFENYDQIGRYRTLENGVPVDARTTLSFGDVQGSVDGAADLSAKLAASADVRSCFLKHTFRWALGRMEHEGDALGAFDGTVEEAFVAVLLSDSFLVRRTP
jgi:hypothetical protein